MCSEFTYEHITVLGKPFLHMLPCGAAVLVLDPKKFMDFTVQVFLVFLSGFDSNLGEYILHVTEITGHMIENETHE